jgi:hypothetical protein
VRHVRLKLRLKVTPESPASGSGSQAVVRRMAYDKVLGLPNGLRTLGPLPFKGVGDPQQYYHHVPIDGIDTSKLHMLIVTFDDYGWGVGEGLAGADRRFGLYATRKYMRFDGTKAPGNGTNKQHLLLEDGHDIDVSSPGGVGTLDTKAMLCIGDIVACNPRIDAEEIQLIPFEHSNTCNYNYDQTWCDCYIHLAEFEQVAEDVTAMYAAESGY